jgi:catechol 2,3-dioxygenase-like lactoylglutathione lyase family enzyme
MGILVGGAATVRVSDLERAVRFYTDVLGLHLRASHAGPSGDSAEVEAPGVKILLHESAGPAQPRRAGATSAHIGIAFEVADLDGAMAALRRRGAEFAPDIEEDPEFRTATCLDPDGLPLTLRARRY